MFGAMKEIDLFLEILNFYAESEPEKKKEAKGVNKIKRFIEEKFIEN